MEGTKNLTSFHQLFAFTFTLVRWFVLFCKVADYFIVHLIMKPQASQYTDRVKCLDLATLQMKRLRDIPIETAEKRLEK